MIKYIYGIDRHRHPLINPVYLLEVFSKEVQYPAAFMVATLRCYLTVFSKGYHFWLNVFCLVFVSGKPVQVVSADVGS